MVLVTMMDTTPSCWLRKGWTHLCRLCARIPAPEPPPLAIEFPAKVHSSTTRGAPEGIVEAGEWPGAGNWYGREKKVAQYHLYGMTNISCMG